MSAIKSHLIWIAVACLLLALMLPNKAQCGFTSPFEGGGPTSREADQLLNGHPNCGALILYSTIASEHPQLLLANLETAAMMADTLASTSQNYDNLVEAFRVIALHLSGHPDDHQSQAVEYWRRACDEMERCANEAMSSPACNSARSAVENFDY
jgi:hypothetical protein